VRETVVSAQSVDAAHDEQCRAGDDAVVGFLVAVVLIAGG